MNSFNYENSLSFIFSLQKRFELYIAVGVNADIKSVSTSNKWQTSFTKTKYLTIVILWLYPHVYFNAKRFQD